VDLVVMGTVGESIFTEKFLGSNTERMVWVAPYLVLIVPAV